MTQVEAASASPRLLQRVSLLVTSVRVPADYRGGGAGAGRPGSWPRNGCLRVSPSRRSCFKNTGGDPADCSPNDGRHSGLLLEWPGLCTPDETHSLAPLRGSIRYTEGHASCLQDLGPRASRTMSGSGGCGKAEEPCGLRRRDAAGSVACGPAQRETSPQSLSLGRLVRSEQCLWVRQHCVSSNFLALRVVHVHGSLALRSEGETQQLMQVSRGGPVLSHLAEGGVTAEQRAGAQRFTVGYRHAGAAERRLPRS